MLALLLLAAQAAPATTILDSCPGIVVRADGESVGDRAIMSPEGDRIVMQCGDGSVLAWRDGVVTRFGDRLTLFEAAKRERLVPEWAKCPAEADTGPTADCSPVDVAPDESAMVVLVSITPYLLRRGARPTELDFRFQPGTFAGGADRLWIADDRNPPGQLAEMRLGATEPKAVVTFPTTNLLFEAGEGRAGSVLYAEAPALMLVTFGGAFRVADEITLIRAYDRHGVERWNYRAKLPARSESLIVGDFPKLFTLAKGAVGALRRSSVPDRFALLDLHTGKVTGDMSGQPLAASREGNVVLVRTGPERVEVRTIQSAAR